MLLNSKQENNRNTAQRSMAVLFTDIVGSSKYFKKNGDMAGRKMLKTHQDLASRPINEFGGSVVKMLGDSVMAYFLNPEDALKSAINIQQRFQSYNIEKKGKEEIHIRLCVHYGDGIIEEGDIFGDVVNMAAKFLPLASGDEILISQQLYSTLKAIPHVRFENFNIPKSNNVLNDLKLFKVIWDSRIELDPTMKTIVHLKPLFNLGSKRFENSWNKIIAEKEKFWNANVIEKEQINNDHSISLIALKASTAYEIAKHITDYIQSNMGRDANLCLPFQIIIDTGAFITAGKISLNNLKVDWNRLEPGEIFISEIAYHLLTKEGESNISLNNSKGSHGSYFIISRNNDNNENDNVFRYQHALVNGNFTPCFYCESQSHDTSTCPSKMLTELTGYVEKLGYMTLANINNLFLNYVQANHAELNNIETMNKNSPLYTAHNAFYDLKSVFQLRLFRTIWNNKEDNWNRIRVNQEEKDRGGRLWIALDCLRVSNFQQVEIIIDSELKKKTNDYKVFCLAGLLYIETNQFKAAASILKRALDIAKRTPEKIYIYFLLFRIHHLMKEHGKAREMLRKIMKLSPLCNEASYFDIVSKFKTGNSSTAMDQLNKLIKKNRDYYIISLIDPELSIFQKEISSNLNFLLIETREKAEKLMPAAKDEVTELEKIMGKDSEEIREANSQITKMEELLKTNSYFGYLDVIHYGEDIFYLGNRIVRGRENKLSKIEEDLTLMMKRCNNYLELLPYEFMVEPASFKLRSIKRSLELVHEKIKNQEAKEFQNTLISLKDFSYELITLENKLRRMDALAQFLAFLSKFFKKNLVFQSANLIISLLVLPVMIHYLNFIIPNINLSTSGIWHYQKVLIILGGITGIILSSLTSQKRTSK